jgi:hypothetical protein
MKAASTTTKDFELIDKIATFINGIGIDCYQGSIPESTFLPGIEILNGSIVYDIESLTYPGDLLHEAGHLAVLLPHHRKLACGSENLSGDLQAGAAEMAAIAWSWAAKEYLGIANEILFHAGGYKDGSENLIDAFNSDKGGTIVGVPLLQWFGMTKDLKQNCLPDECTFPKMIKWLRQA